MGKIAVIAVIKQFRQVSAVVVLILVAIFNFFFEYWVEIRLRPVLVGRVGELWVNPWYQEWIRNSDNSIKRRRVLLVFFCFYYRERRAVANSSVLQYWRQRFHFVPDWLSLGLSDLPRNGIARKVFHRNFLYSWMNDAGEYTLEFLRNACRSGNTGALDLGIDYYFFRKQRGLKEKDRFDRPWVMLHVRDESYLSRSFSDFDWSHHSYRNRDIRLFSASVRHLLDRGYAVVRSGRIAKSRLEVGGDHVLDIPFVSDVSEDEECYLWSNCAFAIGTGSGPDIAAAVSNRPLFFFEVLPVPKTEALVFPAWLVFANRLKSRVTGVDLTFKDLVQKSAYKWFSTDDYDQNQVDVVPASQKELLALTVEVEALFQRFGTNKQLYVPRLRLYPWIEPEFLSPPL